jgi:hypothetical protein
MGFTTYIRFLISNLVTRFYHGSRLENVTFFIELISRVLVKNAFGSVPSICYRLTFCPYFATTAYHSCICLSPQPSCYQVPVPYRVSVLVPNNAVFCFSQDCFFGHEIRYGETACHLFTMEIGVLRLMGTF